MDVVFVNELGSGLSESVPVSSDAAIVTQKLASTSRYIVLGSIISCVGQPKYLTLSLGNMSFCDS